MHALLLFGNDMVGSFPSWKRLVYMLNCMYGSDKIRMQYEKSKATGKTFAQNPITYKNMTRHAESAFGCSKTSSLQPLLNKK